MGAACCVAARDKTIPAVSNGDHHNRDSRYSPTGSYRWENKGCVAGEDASVQWLSDGINSCHCGMDYKHEMTYTAEGGGSLDGFQRRMWPKSPLSDGTVGHVRNSESDQSISRGMSTDTASEQVESRELSACVFPSPTKLSPSYVPSTSLALTPSSKGHLQHAGSTPSRRRSNHSQKLLQMVPGYMTPVGKSPRTPSATVERLPAPSVSNELYRGSFRGISDGWSVNAFTELAVSSCGGGFSLDSEAMGSSHDKMGKTGGGCQMSTSTSNGLQACSVCLKSLTERSSWSAQKITVTSVPVTAVLICGHVYHADCLEVMTSESDKYDPSCPICTLRESKTVEMFEKALIVEMETSVKRDRQSRNQVISADSSMDLARLRIGGSDGTDIMKDSTSASRSPSARPFFRKHFSFGARGSRTLTEVHSSKRRDLFWTKSSME